MSDDADIEDNFADGLDADSRVRKRSLMIAGHATSVSLEEVFWQALKDIAAARGVSVNALVTEIDEARGGNLSSAIRVFVLHAAQDTKSANDDEP